MSDLTDFKRHEHEPLQKRVAALVAENQQQAQATKQLATNLADLQLRLIERNAENQQLRDALADLHRAAAEALDHGTPSEDTE